FVSRSVGVAKLVSLVDDNEVPLDRPQLLTYQAREVKREDENGARVQRVASLTARFSVGLRVYDHSRKVELLLHLERPLLANGRRAYDEQPPAALRPVLAEHDAGFDRLSEAHFVGQNDALGE